jgi:hypothetical protein
LATGEKNSIDKTCEYPFLKDPDYELVLVSLWNKSIYNKCLNANITKLTIDSEAYARNRKIMENISADSNQFVNADCGLMATLLIYLEPEIDYYWGKLGFNENGYSVPERQEGGNILFINPKDKKSLWDRQLRFYCNFE